MPTSQFQAGTVCADDIHASCQNVQDLCDIIKDEITQPYRDNSQTAVFLGVTPRDGLMKRLGAYINWMNENTFGKGLRGGMNFQEVGGSLVFEAPLPSNGIFSGGGPKVVEMPMAGVGDQRLRTGYVMEIPSDAFAHRFHITQEIVDLTNGAPGDTTIAANQNSFVLPSFFQIFASDEGTCGCAPECCADGWREWFLIKKDGRQEKIWVRNDLPAGVTSSLEYGHLGDNTYRVYAVRGVAAHAEPGATTIHPNAYGNAVEIEVGDEIKIGNVVPVSKNGCLPCPTVKPLHYKRKQFHNYAQKMVDQIYCYTEEDLMRSTYTMEPNRLKNEYRRSLDLAMTRYYNILMYGMKTPFIENDLDNAVIPGVGSGNGLNQVPMTTDGLFTLIKKYGQTATLHIQSGCDNRCLVKEFTQLIELLSMHDYSSGNWVLVGDDYVFHMIDQMIINKTTSNSIETSKQLLFGSMDSLSGSEALQLSPGSVLEGINENVFSYKSLKIGNRRIPFIEDMEMKIREPGVMYLLDINSIEFFHPNNELLRRSGYMPATAKSGTVLPNIISNREMVEVNGQFAGYVPKNCPTSIWSYMHMGVWYTPASLPMTFRIEMKGIIEDNSGNPEIVALNHPDMACGCYGLDTNLYKNLLC